MDPNSSPLQPQVNIPPSQPSVAAPPVIQQVQPNLVTPQPPPISKPNNIPSGQALYGIGKLFNESLNLYKTRFVILLGVLTVSLLYSLLIGFLERLLEQTAPFFVSLGISVAFSVVTLTVELLSMAALITTLKYSDERIGVIEAYKRAWQKLFSFAWVMLLTGLIITAGFVLFIIPGVILLVWCIFSIFIVLDEGQTGFSAIKRSMNLVKGKWFAVSWRLFIISLITTVLISVLEYLLGYFGSPAFLTTLVILVLTLLITPFTFIYNYLLYKQLSQT